METKSIKKKIHRNSIAFQVIIFLCILSAFWAIFKPDLELEKSEMKEKQYIANMKDIQLELEKYCQTNHNYPVNINSLVQDGNIKQFPVNPFLDNDIPMKNIDFSPNPSSLKIDLKKKYTEKQIVEEKTKYENWIKEIEGNFTYVPIITQNGVNGYYLLAYGHENRYNSNHDLNQDGMGDNIIYILKSKETSIPLDEIIESLKNDC